MPLFFKELLAGAHFGDAGNHREHDTHWAVHRSPQDRPQLSSEQVDLLERKTYRAQAHGRVDFVGKVELRDELITADIECSDRHGIRLHLFNCGAIDSELIVFAGWGFPGHEEEFGAEQADSLGSFLTSRGYFVDEVDIAAKAQRIAVFGFRRQLIIFEELRFLIIVLLLFLQIITERILGRV